MFLAKGITDGLRDRWRDVQALIIEEVSLTSPRLLGAASYRICAARQNTHGVDPALYSERGMMFGRIPIVILLGDFMQLPPFESKARCSLLMQPRPNSFMEHYRGLDVFWRGLTHVVQLHRTFRFVDRSVSPPRACPYLPAILSYMRNPGGKAMPQEFWQVLTSRTVTSMQDPRLSSPRIVAGYEMAIAWEAVARLMQARVRREARASVDGGRVVDGWTGGWVVVGGHGGVGDNEEGVV